jgi:hypothetical protein
MSPGKAGRSGREVRGRGKRGEDEPLDQFKRCEETVFEAMQLWREDRPDYSDLELLVTSVWQQHLHVMEDSVEQAVKENAVLRVWRGLHYPIIEMLRKTSGGEGSVDEEGQKLLARVLEMFTEQYTTLLGSLEKRHNFHLDQLLGGALCGPKRLKREVVLALILCHWCYVCLGDLSRYQQQLATHPNWAQPRSYYLKAVQLSPKSGRPYNQLAVIAINAVSDVHTMHSRT